MEDNITPILAIDPGTREIGWALLHGKEIIDYGMKAIGIQQTPRLLLQKVSTIINSLIDFGNVEFKLTGLAIKKVSIIQKNAALVAVVAEQIKDIARQAGLIIHEYDSLTIRRYICRDHKHTSELQSHSFISY